MKKNLTALCLLLLLAGIFGHTACTAEVWTDLNLQVDGKAAVVKNDVARAREEAVKNALEKAILQTAAQLLADRYEDEKFQAMKSILIGKADQYIKNYRITSEKSEQDEYGASVSVLVAQSSVRNDLIQMGLLKPSETAAPTSVSVVLKGVKKYADFTRLRNFLQSRTQIVKSVYPCSLEWQQARCELIVTGDVQTLSSDLARSGRYIVETTGKTQDGHEILLRMKEEIK